VASAGGLNASDQYPLQARSGLSDNAAVAHLEGEVPVPRRADYRPQTRDSGDIESSYEGRMQRLRMLPDTTVGNNLVFKHFIVNLDMSKMREQSTTRQNVIKHFWSAVMYHRKALIYGHGPLDRG